MKRFIFFSLLYFIVLSFNLKAQNVSIALKGGVNVANVYGDVAGNHGSLLGFHAGMLAEFSVNSKVDIQPELVYSMQGYRDEGNSGGATIIATTTYHYLNVPVIAKYHLTEDISVEFGPQLGFMIGGTSRVEGGSNSFSAELNLNDFNRASIAAVLGAEYQHESGFIFTARYNYGLTDINKNETVIIRNGVIQLSVGYILSK